MHTSDALSRLHNLTDTPENKDVMPLNFFTTFHPKLHRVCIHIG